MSVRNRLVVVALAGTTLLVLSGCFSSPPSDQEPAAAASCPQPTGSTGLRLAMMLPVTGDEQALGTSITAGVNAAISDINSAGGVLGHPVALATVSDSGDSDHLRVASSSASDIVGSKAAAVIGPLGSSSALTSEPAFTSACVVQYALGYRHDAVPPKSYQFAVAPSDSATGSVLAKKLVGDGRGKVAFVTVDDPTATSVLDATIHALGNKATVVYGNSAGEAGLEPSQLPGAVQAVATAAPDAVVILGPGAEGDILSALADAGVKAPVYLADDDALDYANTVSAAAIHDLTGIVSGHPGSSDLAQTLSSARPAVEQIELATKSYDLAIATALAALAAKGTSGADVRKGLGMIWGGGGTSCSSFSQCASLLKSGKTVGYASQSGLNLQNGSQQIQVSDYTVEDYSSAGTPTPSGTLPVPSSAK